MMKRFSRNGQTVQVVPVSQTGYSADYAAQPAYPAQADYQAQAQPQAGYPAQATSRSATDYPGSLIAIGSRGESVRQIQQCLNKISSRYQTIPKVTADGLFGNATRNAVIMFQRALGLTQDGIVGQQTWGKLMRECSHSYPGFVLRNGSYGEDVRILQHLINIIATQYTAIDYLNEDGIFGNGTEEAVKFFQRLFGLKQDGIVGQQTWNKIIEVVNMVQNGGGAEPPDNGGGNPGGGGSPGGGDPGGTGEMNADELEVFNLINQQRANNGLPALKVDPEVQKVARLKAQDMADNNYFSHTSPTYGSPFEMLQHFGVTYSAAGENIAANPRSSGAVTAWMNSSGHRANILNSTYDYTGIGAVSDKTYGKKFAQIFIEK